MEVPLFLLVSFFLVVEDEKTDEDVEDELKTKLCESCIVSGFSFEGYYHRLL